MNVSERKKVREALKLSEQRFRAVFNNAAVGMDVLDCQGRFVEVNAALAGMLGYLREELIGMSPLDLTHPDDVEMSKEKLAPLVQGRIDTYRLEKRYIRKDGSVLHADVMVSKILDSEGAYDSTIGVIADITERKKAEEALTVRTQQLDERVKELNCLYAISQLREKYGMSLDETLQGVVDLIPPAWQYPELTCARIVLDRQEFKTGNFGTTVAKQVADIVVHGEVAGSLQVGYREEKPEIDEGPFLREERDLINEIAERIGGMLERNRAEEQLKKAHDDLEQRVRERTSELLEANEQLRVEITERRQAEKALLETAAALERSNQDLEQFAYVAAHDLREPLIAVTALLKLLERSNRGMRNEESAKYITRAIDTSLKMDSLIQSLLAYSLAGNTDTAFELTDCNEVMNQVLTNLSPIIKETSARVNLDRLPALSADPPQLTQLVQNLISNALKFAGNEPPDIHIGVKRADEEFRFSVRDNGIGIAPPYFDRVFRIFQRLESAAGRPGSGIGLANCKKIVERHGGSIWVDSQPGAGSTFFFTIPRETQAGDENSLS